MNFVQTNEKTSWARYQKEGLAAYGRDNHFLRGTVWDENQCKEDIVLCSEGSDGSLPSRLKATTKLIELLVKLKLCNGPGGY